MESKLISSLTSFASNVYKNSSIHFHYALPLLELRVADIFINIHDLNIYDVSVSVLLTTMMMIYLHEEYILSL